MEISNELLIDIMAEASHRLHSEIKVAARRGNLENYLCTIGMSDLISIYTKENHFEPLPNGKIIIFGDSQISESEIHGILKTYSIPRDRVELQLGYNVAKSYDFKKLQYNPNYRLILIGPIPHSGESKGDSSSLLVTLENSEGYPKVIRMNNGNSLKITKSGLRSVIEEQIKIGYISYL